MDTLFPAERHRRPRIPRPDTPVPPLPEPAARQWLDGERPALVAAAAHTAAHGWPGHATRLAATLARAVARALLAACAPGGDHGLAPVAEAFRCWTPYRDWEQGDAGIRTLTQVMAAFGKRAGDCGDLGLHALITDDEAVVAEAVSRPGPGQAQLSMTFVLRLSAGLVEEVKIYVDPRALSLDQ